MESIYVINEHDKFASRKFEKKSSIDEDSNMHIYDLKYYETGLKDIENLDEGEMMIGNIKMSR